MNVVLSIVLLVPILLLVLWAAYQLRALVRTYLARRRLHAAIQFSEAQLQLVAQRAMTQLLNEARQSLVDRQP
jgi:hypothetical protein